MECKNRSVLPTPNGFTQILLPDSRKDISISTMELYHFGGSVINFVSLEINGFFLGMN